MKTTQGNPTLIERRFELDGREFQVVTISNKPWWFARDVEAYLGYAPKSLKAIIKKDWSQPLEEGDQPEMVAGEDYLNLSGRDSRRIGGNRGLRRVTLLSESGIHTVSILSRKPGSRRLRRWLADEVLPTVRASVVQQISVEQVADELETAVTRQQSILEFLGWGLRHGVISKDYALRELEQAIAAVKGPTLCRPTPKSCKQASGAPQNVGSPSP